MIKAEAREEVFLPYLIIITMVIRLLVIVVCYVIFIFSKLSILVFLILIIFLNIKFTIRDDRRPTHMHCGKKPRLQVSERKR